MNRQNPSVSVCRASSLQSDGLFAGRDDEDALILLVFDDGRACQVGGLAFVDGSALALRVAQCGRRIDSVADLKQEEALLPRLPTTGALLLEPAKLVAARKRGSLASSRHVFFWLQSNLTVFDFVSQELVFAPPQKSSSSC